MSKRVAKFGVILFLISTYHLEASENEGPLAVMESVDQRYRGDSWIITSEVLLIDKDKSQSQRRILNTGKMYGRDEKNLLYVLEPARIRGTGFLAYDWRDAGRENESWLYLPDLGKVTRLSTANRADYFLGSDFTYGDLEGLEVQDFTYLYAGDEKAEAGQHIILAEPVSKEIIDKYGYKHIRYWVDSGKKVILKAKYWLKDNGWIKYYRQMDFRKYDDVWLAEREQMVMTKHNELMHTSVLTRTEVKINPGVDDGLFTTFSLEREGR